LSPFAGILRTGKMMTWRLTCSVSMELSLFRGIVAFEVSLNITF
jgi:hypothetical protein